MNAKEKKWLTIYLAVWVVSVALGFVDTGATMFFFLEIIILQAIASFAMSWVAGRHGLWGKGRWFLPLILGLMLWLGIVVVIGYVRWYYGRTLESILGVMWSYLGHALLGIVSSVLGLATGAFLSRRKKN